MQCHRLCVRFAVGDRRRRHDARDCGERCRHQLSGAYFSEPATLRMNVTVEPNDANRTLWIEADGDGMYTASEIQLNGANEKRLHQVMFKSLGAGNYTLRAHVRSSTGVRGVATREIEVIGVGPR